MRQYLLAESRISIRNSKAPGKRNKVKTYMCVICGFVYDEAKGYPEDGIEPGTKWEDVPMNWQCPECGAGKEDFEMMEI